MADPGWSQNRHQQAKSNQAQVNEPIDENIETVPKQMSSLQSFFNDTSQVVNFTKMPMSEYNILLLGETGSGKSTTINAFANYLAYSSFEEAANSKFIQLIPSKFTLPHPTLGKPMIIDSGSTDTNEMYAKGTGHSVTQDARGYTFPFGNRLIRIIDTPGMGDTRGVNTDKANFDKILAYLNHHKTLHGICILMKATETRQTMTFRYCITELLTHLHKSACQNIVFCFTFSRNSFYGPGEGFATLQEFIEITLKEVQLTMQVHVNCFFIDNEAFRYFVAKKQNYPFVGQDASYRESWNKSVAQTKLMMERIFNLPPHDLRNTTSLNSARKIILELAEPMVRLQTSTLANVTAIEKQRHEILTSTETREELAQKLHLEVEAVETESLPYPTTVCTAERCTEVKTVNGEKQFNYKQRCHENCGLTGTEPNAIAHPNLQGCAAMSGDYCNECGCHWQKHMHSKLSFKVVKKRIIDASTAAQIKNADDAIAKIQAALQTMEMLVTEYEKEIQIIQSISSKFAYILITNANTIFNQFMEPYIDLQIEEERKMLNAVKGYDRGKYEALVKMKDIHGQNVNILKKAIANKKHEDVKLADIALYRDQLFELKHTGPEFKDIMDKINKSHEMTLQVADRYVAPMSNFFGGAKKAYKAVKNKFAFGSGGSSG